MADSDAETIDFEPKTVDVDPKTTNVVAAFIFMIYLMYWIYLMSFIYVIHLMCWNYLIALIDLITHSRNRNNRNNSIHCNNKGARALLARAPLFLQ